MSDKQWTMNCVLAGAEIQRILDTGDIPAARKLLQKLSSELDDETITYLLHRIVEKA